MSSPTRPGDIPDNVTLRELADGYASHVQSLIEHRYDIGDPLTTEQRLAHALAALAYQHALAERVLYSRCSIATDALAAGASLETVGAAMGGLEPEQVRYTVRRWAISQHRQGLMEDARRDEVLRLAGGGQGGAR